MIGEQSGASAHRRRPYATQIPQPPRSRDNQITTLALRNDAEGGNDHSFMITHADTDEERADVLPLFHRVFNDIAPTAVPMTDAGGMHTPLVVQYRSPDSGQLPGAALALARENTATSRPHPDLLADHLSVRLRDLHHHKLREIAWLMTRARGRSRRVKGCLRDEPERAGAENRRARVSRMANQRRVTGEILASQPSRRPRDAFRGLPATWTARGANVSTQCAAAAHPGYLTSGPPRLPLLAGAGLAVVVP